MKKISKTKKVKKKVKRVTNSGKKKPLKNRKQTLVKEAEHGQFRHLPYLGEDFMWIW